MTLIRSLITAFACFSCIPMPNIEWRESNMRYMMAAFPLVGYAICACVLVWWQLCDLLGFGTILRAAGLTLLPIALSGGIHMDGLADVTDALSSHAPPDRKRAIMKDPHAGAFAALGVGCYLVAYFGLASEMDAQHIRLLAYAPIISRCLSAFVAVTWRPFSQQGMLASVQAAANPAAVRIILAFVFAFMTIVSALANLPGALAMIAAALLVLAWLRLVSLREFGGMNGDLLGYFLQLAELAMLAAIVLVGKLV